MLLSTSRTVRRDMRDWIVTNEGDRWSVKLDVRDLERGDIWTLLFVVGPLLLLGGFAWIFTVGFGLLGPCLFLVPCMELRPPSWRIRVLVNFALLCVVWSSRQPVANAGAVLSLLDGPTGCDPAFCIVWFRFRLLRRYVAYRPEEVAGVCRMNHSASEGCPGHGPAHLRVESAAEVGFPWDSEVLGWERLGLPALSTLAGPIQHFRAAILEAWRHMVSSALCARKGFRWGTVLDFSGTMQLLNSGHVRERDKGSAQRCSCWWSLEWVSAGEGEGQRVSCRFCGGDDNDGHLFWDCRVS